MRRIFLDTETTGLPAEAGHRIIEIGAVEMHDRELTGNYYHQYINPEREVDEGAFGVHGIGDAFLLDKPVMAQIADEFLDFVEGAELIIHNAPFDVGFLNHELRLLGRDQTIETLCEVTDTLAMARKKYPGARASLDALVKRYGITQFNRDLHGALLDAEILAQVYLMMTGGQSGLGLSFDRQDKAQSSNAEGQHLESISIHPVPVDASELALHQQWFEQHQS
ncbi:DNA polymerase III subunit epsilon [Ostreibacterium oceani]|uniref:DNA polymerase III subunit epsilon n=1 Tax=Ostreibacterium oceani TaxID=2654998 RepID=A0A6N7EUQ4_9GAMM|nr:DNA polymerase III subunit epsilon [Ostreibacterium oceani]MPV85703.1 DNA polymerase III subunit epsilon [Ostreibacterium oceani]